jgi:hypothetical protein
MKFTVGELKEFLKDKPDDMPIALDAPGDRREWVYLFVGSAEVVPIRPTDGDKRDTLVLRP